MSEDETDSREVDQSRAQPSLVRSMTLFHVTMIGVGAMIGAGIFVLTGIAAGEAGPALILAFVLNGLVTGLTAMTYAELGSCFPEAGGGYLWVKQALPGAHGFLAGWMSWFAHAVACSLYALGFGSYLVEAARSLGLGGALPEATLDLTAKLVAVIIILVFTYINFRGAAEAGAAEGFVTIAKLVVLSLFVLSGLWAISHLRGAGAQFTPFMPRGWSGVLVAMGLTFIAFEGYEIIAQCGEEVKEPKRNIPRAVFVSLLVVVPVYVLVAVVCLGASRTGGVPSWQWLRDLSKPELGVVEAARSFMVGGPVVGGLILLVGGLFATVSALNATVYSSSRVSYAMGRDRNLPTALAAVHPKRRTPHVALAVSTVIIIVMAVALPIEKVAAATDLMFLFLFLQVNTALIVLRKRRPDLDRGYRVPWVPFVPLLANGTLAALVAYLAVAHSESFIYAVGWVLAGLVIHRVYARPREKEVAESKVAFVRTPPHKPGYAVLVALANPAHVPNLMAVACAAAKRRGGHVVAISVIRVPSPTPLEAGWSGLAASEAVLADALAEGQRWGVPVLVMARVGRSVPKAVLDVIQSHQINLLVLGWRGYSGDEQRVLGAILDPLVRSAATDIAILKAPYSLPGVRRRAGKRFEILCPTTGSRHGALGMELTAALADLLNGQARFLHIRPPGRPVAEGVRRLVEGGVPVDAVESGHVEDTLMHEAAGADLLVMGASRETALQLVMFGSMPESVARQVDTPVILVKRYAGKTRGALRELFRPLEPEEIAAFEQHQTPGHP